MPNVTTDDAVTCTYNEKHHSRSYLRSRPTYRSIRFFPPTHQLLLYGFPHARDYNQSLQTLVNSGVTAIVCL